MFVANIILSFTTIVALALGLFIFVSNSRKSVNQALAFYIFCIFLWMVANLLTNISSDPTVSLMFARSTLVGAAFLPYAFLIFSIIYTKGVVKTRHIVGWIILPVLILLTTPTNLNVISVESYGVNTKVGSIYALLVIELIVYFAMGALYLGRESRNPNTDSTKKLQIRYILAGIIFAAIPGIIANGLLPALGFVNAVFYGPSIVIVLAITTSVAIVRHRLLNIRLLVARSIAYLFTLLTVTSLFSLIVFGVFSRVIGTTGLSVWQQYLYVGVAILLAFTFQPLKAFFDKITNKLFYRDAYDPQQLLDSLNKVLVSTIELGPLMNSVSSIIAQTLKSEFCAFSVERSAGVGIIIGTNQVKQFNVQETEALARLLHAARQKVITTDELPDNRSELKETLRNNDIAITAHLQQSSHRQSEGLGYLAIGAKKSGNPYSVQDTKILEIIADELVIAVQNALRFEEIQTFNITLQSKVDEATHKLRAANEKLKALDQTKDDFISMASHQLRTPLTSVKGYVSMVLDEDAGKISAQQRKLLDQAFVSSQRMVYLIADLLNVSRLKTGKFVIDAKPTNLADVVESELAQL